MEPRDAPPELLLRSIREFYEETEKGLRGDSPREMLLRIPQVAASGCSTLRACCKDGRFLGRIGTGTRLDPADRDAVYRLTHGLRQLAITLETYEPYFRASGLSRRRCEQIVNAALDVAGRVEHDDQLLVIACGGVNDPEHAFFLLRDDACRLHHLLAWTTQAPPEAGSSLLAVRDVLQNAAAAQVYAVLRTPGAPPEVAVAVVGAAALLYATCELAHELSRSLERQLDRRRDRSPGPRRPRNPLGREREDREIGRNP